MRDTWQRRLDHQRAVLKEGRGHFVICAGYSEGGPAPEGDPYIIEGQSSTLSEDFLRKYAFDLGVQNVRNNCSRCMRAKEAADDDSIPGFYLEWGSGFAAALFTGGAVHFQEGTSYLADTFVKTWDDIERLKFDPDNRWVQYALSFWRGVSSEYVEGTAITPHIYRSPLDLANDLRGNRIFEDMCLEPEQVERLVGKCTDMIIEADRYYRSEIPLLREAPGGAWEIGLPAPGMLMVNGDPVDLVSPEMGERFNNPYIERLADYAGSVYFHHHTLGVSRVRSVARTRGLTVQQFTPDPKCQRVYDILDDGWVEASNRVPIDIWQDLLEAPDVDAALDKMRHGRFVVHFSTQTLAGCRRLVDRIRCMDT